MQPNTFMRSSCICEIISDYLTGVVAIDSLIAEKAKTVHVGYLQEMEGHPPGGLFWQRRSSAETVLH
jgi:hypothetical protein